MGRWSSYIYIYIYTWKGFKFKKLIHLRRIKINKVGKIGEGDWLVGVIYFSWLFWQTRAPRVKCEVVLV